MGRTSDNKRLLNNLKSMYTPSQISFTSKTNTTAKKKKISGGMSIKNQHSATYSKLYLAESTCFSILIHASTANNKNAIELYLISNIVWEYEEEHYQIEQPTVTLIESGKFFKFVLKYSLSIRERIGHKLPNSNESPHDIFIYLDSSWRIEYAT
jgi:hypothetical protein